MTKKPTKEDLQGKLAELRPEIEARVAGAAMRASMRRPFPNAALPMYSADQTVEMFDEAHEHFIAKSVEILAPFVNRGAITPEEVVSWALPSLRPSRLTLRAKCLRFYARKRLKRSRHS